MPYENSDRIWMSMKEYNSSLNCSKMIVLCLGRLVLVLKSLP